MQFLKERNLLKNKFMLPCLFQVLCIYTDRHPLCIVAVVSVHVFESFPRRFQFSHAETNPHCHLTPVCESLRGVKGKFWCVLRKHSISGPRSLLCGAPCYTVCIGVPQYLCHKSMAFVTMASVFSCGILHRNLTTPSGRLIPINTIL